MPEDSAISGYDPFAALGTNRDLARVVRHNSWASRLRSILPNRTISKKGPRSAYNIGPESSGIATCRFLCATYLQDC